MEKFTLDTDLVTSDKIQVKAWMMEFRNLVENAFANCGNEQRLLGNLVVLTRYRNTLQQGLAREGKVLSLGLRRAVELLWDFLEKNTSPLKLADFSNLLYDCHYINSVGESDELPEPFYTENFGNGYPCAYEWMAVEWASGLLMQLVAIAGGRLDYDDFEDFEHVDFYGVHLLLDQLEVITENWETLSFQKIAQIVKNDLQRARNSCPEMFVLLRSEYQKYTLMTEENAKKLLDY